MIDFLAVVGFLVIVATAIGLTVFTALVCFLKLGKYNIGGVPNTSKEKLFAFLWIITTIGYWFLVIRIAPFKVTLLFN